MNSFTILIGVLAMAAYGMANQADESRLHEALLKDYHKDVEPDHLNVTFGVNIQCGRFCEHTKRFFTSVWERYTWTDSRMAWDPSEYGGVSTLRVCPDDLWLPDFRLYYSSNPKVERGHVRGMLTSEGKITWIVPTLYENFCKKIDDTIHCDYKIGSWVYSDVDMAMNMHDLGVSADFHDDHCPYIATVGKNEIVSKKYPCCPETFSSLVFSVDYTKAE